MRRRDFITLLGGAITSRPIPANAQPAVRMRTVGVLIGLGDDAEARSRLMAFEQGLKTEGWSVGQNLRIEYRYAEGDSGRMQAFAKELVELKPDCIVGHSTPVVIALKHATRTIPIVFVSVSNPTRAATCPRSSDVQSGFRTGFGHVFFRRVHGGRGEIRATADHRGSARSRRD
jgi:putative ABC transport system substrate-binding protein